VASIYPLAVFAPLLRARPRLSGAGGVLKAGPCRAVGDAAQNNKWFLYDGAQERGDAAAVRGLAGTSRQSVGRAAPSTIGHRMRAPKRSAPRWQWIALLALSRTTLLVTRFNLRRAFHTGSVLEIVYANFQRS
jgi:hypothetical protein